MTPSAPESCDLLIEAGVGRVFLRGGGGGSAALRMSAISRSSASARFISCERKPCAVITSTPSWVSREPASR